MANPRFESGTDMLQFSKGIKYPVSRPHEKLQAVDRTAAGTLQVEDLGIDLRTRVLVFKGLPQTDYDALVAWYDTVCQGARNTFDYYDENGNGPITVRMMTNPLDFVESFYQRFDGELLLEVV